MLLYLLGYAALAGAAFLAGSVRDCAAVCLVSRAYCVTETGQGLLRWGVIAALLGVAMNGIPFFYRKVEMPNMNKER